MALADNQDVARGIARRLAQSQVIPVKRRQNLHHGKRAGDMIGRPGIGQVENGPAKLMGREKRFHEFTDSKRGESSAEEKWMGGRHDLLMSVKSGGLIKEREASTNVTDGSYL
jgi:hypothetical protein